MQNQHQLLVNVNSRKRKCFMTSIGNISSISFVGYNISICCCCWNGSFEELIVEERVDYSLNDGNRISSEINGVPSKLDYLKYCDIMEAVSLLLYSTDVINSFTFNWGEMEAILVLP